MVTTGNQLVDALVFIIIVLFLFVLAFKLLNRI